MRYVGVVEWCVEDDKWRGEDRWSFRVLKN